MPKLNPNRNKEEKARQRKRKAGRATYDLPPELKEKVADLSVEYGVPQSQIVAALLYYSIEELEAGSIDFTGLRTKSTSPKFSFNLDLKKAKERFKRKK